jgi:hypothetical protein
VSDQGDVSVCVREDLVSTAIYTRGVMLDTGAEASRRYHELLRARAPHERLAQALALTKMVRELAVAGIRSRHPDASPEEVRVRLAVRLYGREAARRLFGELPSDAV